MTTHNFEIEFKLVDGREYDTFPGGKPFHYRIIMKSGEKTCSMWSEALDEEEIGTYQSFRNIADNLNWQILKALCPEEAAIKHEHYKKLIQEARDHKIKTNQP